MSPEDLKQRTKKFALEVLRFCDDLPRGRRSTEVLAKQLIRSASSVGANYRSACKGRSKPEFISKLNIAEEEADESNYWLELLNEIGTAKRDTMDRLIKESKEITAILTSSGRTAKLSIKNK